MLRAERMTVGAAGDEDGQVIVLMALFLALVGLAIVGTVLDSGLLGARNSAADAAAYLGAQAGAGTVNDAAFYSGTLALVGTSGGSCTEMGTGSPLGRCEQDGAPTAAGVCAAVAAQNDALASVRVTCLQSGRTVTATVQQTITFPVSVFGVGGNVTSTRSAGATFGTNHSVKIPPPS